MGVRILLGFPVAYVKLWVDAVLYALGNLGWVPERWTEYDQHMTFLKFESNLPLGLQTKIMKLLEQIWEAVPQLALAITYYVNNKYYIWFTETSLPVPTTIISMTLSAGSVLMGLYIGATATRDVAIIIAVKNGKARRLKLLLRLGADPKMYVSKNVPAINHALREGYEEVVDILIQAGGYVNSEDAEGETPLHVASTKGHVEVVRRLITAGADVNKKREDGRTPIHMASDNGHVEVVDILTHEGGDVNHDRHIG